MLKIASFHPFCSSLHLGQVLASQCLGNLESTWLSFSWLSHYFASLDVSSYVYFISHILCKRTVPLFQMIRIVFYCVRQIGWGIGCLSSNQRLNRFLQLLRAVGFWPYPQPLHFFLECPVTKQMYSQMSWICIWSFSRCQSVIPAHADI